MTLTRRFTVDRCRQPRCMDQLNMGNSEEANDAGNWGLLGLLGLAGLMGRRRADRDAPMTRRDATAR